jgi:hypothetical protein
VIGEGHEPQGTTFWLTSASGAKYRSTTPGVLGGHARLRIFGRLDCPSALRHLRNGGYRKHRVFFENEQMAIAAGFRPCSRCLPSAYRAWRVTGYATGSAAELCDGASTRVP